MYDWSLSLFPEREPLNLWNFLSGRSILFKKGSLDNILVYANEMTQHGSRSLQKDLDGWDFESYDISQTSREG